MRQVSFTLLMTRHCDSNLAQYERNSRFGHLVHALARSGNGAKLPSVGLCLNASKAESRLVMAMIFVGLVFCVGKDRVDLSPLYPATRNFAFSYKCCLLTSIFIEQSEGL